MQDQGSALVWGPGGGGGFILNSVQEVLPNEPENADFMEQKIEKYKGYIPIHFPS